MSGDIPGSQVPLSNKDYAEAAVVIVGGGISGMCTAIDLIRYNNCRNFLIIEKSGGLGGTWRDNRYPGCCCDVWSHLYSFSFEQNPDWTREYPGQEEILRYLTGIAQKYELYGHVRLNTQVESARWDDASGKWKTTVSVQGGKDAEFGSTYTITSDFLVSGVGQLNQPKYPDIPGLDEFQGKLMHSARWDWTYDLKGKRVAIIGNGATAAQIIPEISKEVKHLTVHQRTPNWVIPRLDQPIAAWKRSLYRYLPYTRWRKRADMMDFREGFHAAIFDNESIIAQGMEAQSRAHLQAQLPSRPDLWELLQPKYSIGCKRVIISDDYFPTFLRDNVSLESGKIEKITGKGIVVDGKESEYDVIVLATGFRTVEFLHAIEVSGRAGRELSSIWSDGCQALYGVTVEDLPNFGMLYGPNTNLGHNSIILMIEAQSRYINALIREVLEAKRHGHRLIISPKAKRVEQYNAQIQAKLEGSSFADPACQSWYKTEAGKITNNWSGTVVEYQKILSAVDWSNDYDVVGGDDNQHRHAKTNLGRVREETRVSYNTMGWALVTSLAVGAAVALRASGAKRFKLL